MKKRQRKKLFTQLWKKFKLEEPLVVLEVTKSALDWKAEPTRETIDKIIVQIAEAVKVPKHMLTNNKPIGGLNYRENSGYVDNSNGRVRKTESS